MKKFNAILLIAIGLFIFSSCGTDGNPNPEPDPVLPIFPDSTVDVYIAGSENNGNGISVAKYWKNGIAVELTDGTKNSAAIAIAISNNDVYIAGSEEGTSDINAVLKYWKNGVAINLTDGTTIAIVYSIAVSNNDVYVVGSEYIDGHYVAKYWKNGISTVLSNSTMNTEATSVLIHENNVYITGKEYSDDVTYRRARLWKNGVNVPIVDSERCSSLSIAISGNDIYMTGFEAKLDFVGNEFRMAKYWKNDQSIFLDTSNYSMAQDIEVSGNEIYISGSTGISFENTTPVYWKNGVLTSLLEGATSGYALSILNKNNYLYVSGTRDNKAALWINNHVFFNLTNISSFYDLEIVER